MSYNYIKCFKCGAVGKGFCGACQRPVCDGCRYRHPDCSEGR